MYSGFYILYKCKLYTYIEDKYVMCHCVLEKGQLFINLCLVTYHLLKVATYKHISI